MILLFTKHHELVSRPLHLVTPVFNWKPFIAQLILVQLAGTIRKGQVGVARINHQNEQGTLPQHLPKTFHHAKPKSVVK